MTLRIIIAISFLGILLWFGLSDRAIERRRSAVTAALARGLLGGLSRGESESFLRELQWLASSCQIEKPVLLNALPSTNHLNVYTCLPGSEHISFCPRGNAVYEPQIDTIFVDVGIIRPSDLWVLGKDPPQSDAYKSPEAVVYRRFVLLHEMGHRQKHRGAEIIYDSPPVSTVSPAQWRELDADQFAYDHMVTSYAEAIKVGNGDSIFPRFIGEAPSLGEHASIDENTNADECAAVDIAAMGVMMTWMSFYSSSQFAPFFQDSAHPMFPLRAQALIKRAVSSPGISPQARSEIRERSQIIQGILRARMSGCTQLLFPHPIRDMAFDRDGIVMVGLDNATFRVPRRKIKQSHLGSPLRVVAVSGPCTPSVKSFDLKMVFGLVSGGCGGFDSHGRFYFYRKDRWLRCPDVAVPLYFGRFPRIFLPPQPTEYVAVERLDSDEGDIELIWQNQRTAIVNLKRLEATLAQMGIPGKIKLELNRADPERLYFTIQVRTEGQEPRFFGVATVDPRTLQVVNVSPLNLPNNLQERPRSNRMLAYQAASNCAAVLLDAAAIPKRPWSFWGISTNKPEQLLDLETRPTGQEVPAGDEFDSLVMVPPHTALMNNRYSTLTVDLAKKKTSLLLSPGVPRIRVASSGLVLVFEIAGQKAYLYSLND